MSTGGQHDRRVVAIVAILLLLFAGLAVRRAWVKSETYDEPMYMLSGYSYVVTGDLSFNREHPPFAKYLIGLPLLLLDVQLPGDYQVRPGIEFAFYAHQPNADTHPMLFLSRLPGVLLGLLLGLYVWRWGSIAFGWRAGLAALSLVVLNPNVIGHATTASNDFANAVFCFATLFHLWRWLETDSRRSLAFGAIALGLAIGSKLTALVLLPVMGGIVLVTALRRRRPALLGHGLLALAASGGVLWLLYLGEARTLGEVSSHPRFVLRGEESQVFRSEPLRNALHAVFGDDTPIPMLSFLKGIDHQLDHANLGHHNYWRGETSTTGRPEFYVVSWLFKNPEAFTFLALLGLVAWRRTRRSAVHEWALLAFPVLVFVIFSRGNAQLGFKYILPVVPFLAVAASRVLAVGPGEERPLASAREGRVGAVLVLVVAVGLFWFFGDVGAPRWTHALPLVVPAIVAALLWPRRATAEPQRPVLAPAAVLLLWAAAGTLSRQPHNLMYFNEWVGGPENGHEWSVIGDDWGQDTRALGLWMQEQGVEQIAYDYYGEGDPEVWGVRSRPTFGDPRTYDPIEGWVAVHIALLRRMPEAYGFLAGKDPVAILAHTIYVYRLTSDDRIDSYFAPRGPPGDDGN